MVIFNALLNLNELKELYSGKPVCVCPLYNGVLNTSKTFEATGNPITIPEYKQLVKLKTTFSPKQAGTGDPSPDNVRTISGWDSVKVTVSNESESHDYNITLPETIYGGTVDAVSGEGEKTWEILELNGTENWNNCTFDGKPGFYAANLLGKGGETYARVEGLCNITTVYENSDFPYTASNYIWCGVNNKNVYWVGAANLLNTPTISEFKSYLATQAAAGTPVTICYKLATPEPFEISQVSIPSLGGENKFFTNGENMDIIYKENSFWG